jgi:hypothetical protein
MQPAVTMVMPVHNGERFVGAAIESLLAQTFRDFALLVVDDASTDGTRERVAGYTDARVRLLATPHRVGPAAARNRGLDEARSPYVGFLDSDDIAEPVRLERQVARLSRQDGVGLVAALASIIDGHGHPTGGVWGWFEADALIAPTMFFRNHLPTSTILVARDAIGRERFDPTLDVASDYDLWVRVLRRTGAANLPEPLVRYRIHPGGVTHERRAATASCLERIARRQLTRLGVAPSEREMATHTALAAGCLQGPATVLADVAAWLARLEDANRHSGLYAAHAFRRVIDGEWLAACDAVARGGCWDAWPLIARSPRTARLAADPGRWRPLARLPWRTVRGYRRRRWPGLGSALGLHQ